LQTDQEKFLRRVGLLRCVQELSHHFPDLLIILVVVHVVVTSSPVQKEPDAQSIKLLNKIFYDKTGL
jgi:hypothetical protein